MSNASVAVAAPTRVYRTSRAAQRDRGGVPILVAGTYAIYERRGHLIRLPAGWINTKGHT
ncbi:hypothetical protein [uncultured Microbacterium sp.]|uniref:hypothetical protein n=1 Tax=uncultured Microbacterium sp. TaxID=191216 RepID=UPI0025EA86F9|nr:hypothetical protein [uncultured Microbacterium sp.]